VRLTGSWISSLVGCAHEKDRWGSLRLADPLFGERCITLSLSDFAVEREGRKMKAKTLLLISGATMTLILSGLGAQRLEAQQPAAAWSQQDSLRVVGEVQKRLGRLANYAVFDWITFGQQGKTITLKGYASRPSLKDDAERAIKDIPGVEKVDNEIEVLPNSPNDDRIRAAVYNRIYTQPALRKYNVNPGSLARAMGPSGRSLALMAGGITNTPPIGYHAIHIVVKNGHVMLFGAVLNSGDVAFANTAANSAPGAFSVENELVVAGSQANK
jgi:osmotically-inducible protein OsmY